HLDLLAVLALGLDEQSALGGVVAAGLFDVNVLACLKSEDGHRCVPVVGRGDGDGVYIFGGEGLAEVFVGGGRIAELLLDGAGELVESVAVDVADVGDLRMLLVCLERGEVGIGAAVEADYGKIDTVIGTKNLGIAFGGRADSKARCSYCKTVEKFTSRDHISSLGVFQIADDGRFMRPSVAG